MVEGGADPAALAGIRGLGLMTNCAAHSGGPLADLAAEAVRVASVSRSF
jgi:hypothetical protein